MGSTNVMSSLTLTYVIFFWFESKVGRLFSQFGKKLSQYVRAKETCVKT